MAEGRRRVKERFGIELEPEVQALGPVEFPADWSRRDDRRASGRGPAPGEADRGARLAALALLGGAWVWLRDSSLVAVKRVTRDRRVGSGRRPDPLGARRWRRGT